MPETGPSPIATYDANASEFARRYEGVSASHLHGPLADFLPRGSGLLALDIGAGSGRDAAWLTSLGYNVVAVEPASGMRREGGRLHPDAKIRWVDDRLPARSQLRATRSSRGEIRRGALILHWGRGSSARQLQRCPSP